MNDYDIKCVDLAVIHGKAERMVCVLDYSSPEYKDAISPYDLSASYRVWYTDGAVVDIGCVSLYTLSQGSFWYNRDSLAEIHSVFARDTRILAYLALGAAKLRRERPGECILLQENISLDILKEIGIPLRPLACYGELACKNREKWMGDWHRRGLIEHNDFHNCWAITKPNWQGDDGMEVENECTNSVKAKKDAIKAKIASMTPQEKVLKVIEILNKKIENDPSNKEYQYKLFKSKKIAEKLGVTV